MSEKKQRAKGGVARDQLVDRLARKLVGDHLPGGHETTAGAPCNQAAPVKAVVGAIGGQHFVPLGLRDIALDEDEQMGGHRPHLQHHGTFREIGNVHAGAHQALLVRGQAVKGRG